MLKTEWLEGQFGLRNIRDFIHDTSINSYQTLIAA